ncbi:hypothetical protein O3M35_001625 [Rhynocoris fuscipes]|uniref:Pre-rRNA-processing protein TSR2 homolog n=1 Tax=Rhynocoris fuscipes TaxID=488301 RepID=A0AAW1CP45_9HEMI
MEDIIGIVFNNWSGLKMSIEHGMGGNNYSVSEKLLNMINIIMDNLNSTNYSWENISDNLDDIMDNEFNTLLEDNSSDEVAKVICELYLLWKNGDQENINIRLNKFQEKTPLQNKYQMLPPPVPQQRNNIESDTAGNTYEVEEMPDDGWTEVKYRR